MKLIIHKRKNGKSVDSIEYILSADKREFNEIIKTLKDPKGILDVVYQEEIDDPDTTLEIFSVSSFLDELSKIQTDQKNSEQKKRISKIQQCRTEQVLKRLISKEYKVNKREVKEIFGVLEGKEPFSKFIDRKKIERRRKSKEKNIFSFLNSKKNKELPQGEESIEDYYYKIMSRICSGDYFFQFFIPGQKEHLENFRLISSRVNAEKRMRDYPIIIGKEDEPNWEINDELKEYVYSDMPEDITSEEKAIWIYMKLCKTLRYDDSKVFENVDNRININLLRNIKPNSNVICFDFARIYAKFINSMSDNNMEAKVVGGKGHFLVNLISKDVIMTAEATKAISNTNEFFKLKMGLPIEGLRASYDPKGVMQSSIDKFTPIIYKDVHTINSYLDMLDVIRTEETEKGTEATKNSNLYNKLNSLVKTMKENNVSGTEAIMGIVKFLKLGFFGDDTDGAWIGMQGREDDEIKYKSGIIFNQKSNNQFGIIDSAKMQVAKVSKEYLLEKFKSGKYRYKDPNYTIEALKEDLSILEQETTIQGGEYEEI